jgi:predicted SprT family Zn-dependent metalloprotease
MELNQAQSLAIVLMNRHGLLNHNFKFNWDLSKRHFGLMNGPKRLIVLSARLVFLNNEETVKDTILHEIAHALDFIRNGYKYRRCKYTGQRLIHDDIWKNICIEVGCKPRRCYTPEDVVCPPSNKRLYKWKLVHIATNKTLRISKNRVKKYQFNQYIVDGLVSNCRWEPYGD